MIGYLIAFAVGYLLARNQEALVALLLRTKAAKDLLPPKDPPPQS